ncbi:MAG TPA: hypothetical protein VFO01_06955 [Trebonia sp.]|nr:hypothetical protein [Trebonia sp.]
MHRDVELKVLYFGTPVVLIGTRNADATANLAPMSSAWWLGEQCMLGMKLRLADHAQPAARARVHAELAVP